MREKLLEMKNKDFVYRCIDILITKSRKDDIEMLTKPTYCKQRFDMNYAILQEVPLYGTIPEIYFKDHCLNRRYYPQPIMAFGKRYIVCNDWYYKTKGNTRDTRTNFVDWVLL